MLPLRDRRYPGALAASALAHCLVVVLLALAARFASNGGGAEPSVRLERPVHLTWLVKPQSGGGGGGGGNAKPRPARELKARGREEQSVPAVQSQAPAAASARIEKLDAVQRLDIPAVPSASALEHLPGALVAIVPAGDSQGPGHDGGAGAGRDGGIGPGAGLGLDAGRDGGTGSGPPRPGGGVSEPVLIRETKPVYTQQAMQARIQGLVELDAVVLPDGTVGPIRIVRSLDSRFGLDERAVDAVKDWRFRPAVHAGRAVAVLVRIELTFTLR